MKNLSYFPAFLLLLTGLLTSLMNRVLFLSVCILLALPSAARAQAAPPNAGATGFVAFVETNESVEGDVVTIVNTGAGSGLAAGQAINLPPIPSFSPNQAAVTSNTAGFRWLLRGKFSRNEQIRGREARTESPLVIAFPGGLLTRVIVLVPTIFANTAALEMLIFTPGNPNPIAWIINLTGSTAGPYPPTVVPALGVAFVSDYGDGDAIRVHAINLLPALPSLVASFKPPANQNIAARCAGYMVFDPETGTLQVPTTNGFHSLGFALPGGFFASIFHSVPTGTIVGTDARILTTGGAYTVIFGARTASPNTPVAVPAAWVAYSPFNVQPQIVTSLGNAPSGHPWDLALGFYTPALGAEAATLPTQVVTFLLDDPSAELVGPGRVVQVRADALTGPIPAAILDTDFNPFEEPEAARNPTGDPVSFMLSSSDGDFNTGSIDRVTSLGPTGIEIVLNADVLNASGGGRPGLEIMGISGTAGSSSLPVPQLTSRLVFPIPLPQLQFPNPSSSLTTPYVGGPLTIPGTAGGPPPLFAHAFASDPMIGFGSPFAAPPVVLSRTAGGPQPGPNTGRYYGFRRLGLLRRIPSSQRIEPGSQPGTWASRGPTRPVFTHGSPTVINTVFHERVNWVGNNGNGGQSQVTVYLGGVGQPAFYTLTLGEMVLSEFFAF